MVENTSSKMFAHKGQVADNIGLNKAFLDTNATLVSACKDKFDSIASIAKNHLPFKNNGYWTTAHDESSAVDNTSVFHFANDFSKFSVVILKKLAKLKVDLRKMRSTDTTEYAKLYRRATGIMTEFYNQYSDTVRATLLQLVSHSKAEASQVIRNVLSTDVVPVSEFANTAMNSLRAALPNLSELTQSTPVYQKIADVTGKEPGQDGYVETYQRITDKNGVEPDQDGYVETYAIEQENGADKMVHRHTHIANMNPQQQSTVRRMVELMNEPWNVASISLADIKSKFAGTDYQDSSMGLSQATTRFSKLLSNISGLQASGEKFSRDLEEYLDISRGEGGDPLYPTDGIKDSVEEYLQLFDGNENTPTNSDFDIPYSTYDLSLIHI